MSIMAVIAVSLLLEPCGDGEIAHVEVLYCDACRRWGRVGSSHLCGTGWFEKLHEMIDDLAAEEA